MEWGVLEGVTGWALGRLGTRRIQFLKHRIWISGALSGLMLDLGLLKIILEEFFSPYFYPTQVALILRGPILIHFLNLQGKASLYFT